MTYLSLNLGMALACVLTSAASAQSESVIYSLPSGSYPHDNLYEDPKGTLYGTTTNGGGHGNGTVFELNEKDGVWRGRTIYKFAGGTADGSNPYSGIVSDDDGTLYGTTSY